MERMYFAAYNKNDDIRKQSSSGGVFFSLAKYVISKKGVVFGATWNKDWLVDITYTETLEGVRPMMTSKYVLANVSTSFEDCKRFLEQGRLVLYTSIPCQIHGLKNYLKKDYDNLICVDICCHGTMPIQIWKDYLETIQKPNNPIVSINMRDKEHGWTGFGFKVVYKDDTSIYQRANKNIYMNAFLCDAYLRPCCYACKFKMNYSVSDLIIGDYWGISKFHPGLNKENKGISVVVTNTLKGFKLLKRSHVHLVKTSEEGVIQSSGGMRNNIRTDKIKSYVKEEVFK